MSWNVYLPAQEECEFRERERGNEGTRGSEFRERERGNEGTRGSEFKERRNSGSKRKVYRKKWGKER